MHQRLSGREIFKRSVERLSRLYSESEARAIIHWLMEDLLDLSRVQIAMGGEVTVTTDGFDKALERLVAGEPIQYVLGYAWFRGNKIHVAPGVLIPRPETELAVDAVLEDLRQDSQVLDIGAGSGCIGVSIARERSDVQVMAWDISPTAIVLTRQNAASAGVSIAVQQVDALRDWPQMEVDVVVSNPPYILEREKSSMHQNVVGFEPQEALFVPDDDPLRFYQAIASKARSVLSEGGRIVFEINERFGQETADLLLGCGYKEVEVRKDIFEKDRVVTGSR